MSEHPEPVRVVIPEEKWVKYIEEIEPEYIPPVLPEESESDFDWASSEDLID
jgi:hypothetical protein